MFAVENWIVKNACRFLIHTIHNFAEKWCLCIWCCLAGTPHGKEPSRENGTFSMPIYCDMSMHFLDSILPEEWWLNIWKSLITQLWLVCHISANWQIKTSQHCRSSNQRYNGPKALVPSTPPNKNWCMALLISLYIFCIKWLQVGCVHTGCCNSCTLRCITVLRSVLCLAVLTGLS